MVQQIAILHLEKAKQAGGADRLLCSRKWVKWETCLRTVYFGTVNDLPPDLPSEMEVYRGPEAYFFCLHTVSGLKSPMIGETEVWGQFKGLFRDFDFSALENGAVLQRFVQSIFSDGKLVRHNHLTGLGSQSYGSLARRILRGLDEINIVGSGKLVKEMLPWLAKGPRKVRIFCRRPDQGRELFQELKIKPAQFEVVGIDRIESVNCRGGLVVAAPVSGDWVQRFFSGQFIEKTVDLRDNSTKDRLQMNCDVIALNEFFKEIESTRIQVAEKVVEAERKIRLLTDRRFSPDQVNHDAIRARELDEVCS